MCPRLIVGLDPPVNGESLASQQKVGEGIKASMTGMMWME